MRQHGKWRVVFVLTLSVAALCLAGAQERAVVDQVRGTVLTAKVPVDPAITTGRFDNGLRYYIRVNRAAGQPDRAAAGGERGLDPGRRRPAGARALRRAHGLQRDEELPERRRPEVLRVDRHAVRPEPERRHQLRPDGLHAADPDRQARGRAEGASRSSKTGRTTSRSSPRKSRRSAASSSRSGDWAAARARGCRTSSCRSC